MNMRYLVRRLLGRRLRLFRQPGFLVEPHLSLFRVNTDTCYLSNTDGVGNADEFLREGKVRRRPTGNVHVEQFLTDGCTCDLGRDEPVRHAPDFFGTRKMGYRLNEALSC